MSARGLPGLGSADLVVISVRPSRALARTPDAHDAFFFLYRDAPSCSPRVLAAGQNVAHIFEMMTSILLATVGIIASWISNVSVVPVSMFIMTVYLADSPLVQCLFTWSRLHDNGIHGVLACTVTA